MASKHNIDVVTRHQVFLERLKSSTQADFLPYLRRIDKAVRDVLSKYPDGMTNAKMNKALRELKTVQQSIYAEYINDFLNAGADIAEAEAAFEARLMQNVSQAVSVAEAQGVYAAVQTVPMSVRGPQGGKLLDAFVTDWADGEIAAVNNLVRQGVSEGRTISQVILDIRGTSGRKFADGQFSTTDRHARAMVRTAVQHISSQARQQVWKANEDIIDGVEWLSVLDSRTTTQCSSLDGEVFPVDEGPRPPLHVGCRSTTVMKLKPEFEDDQEGKGTRVSKGADGGEQVSETETYYSWLNKQPAEFQAEAIGPVRAKLLRDGGLSSDEFARLQIGRNFEPLTLAEMKQLEPLAFERAGI